MTDSDCMTSCVHLVVESHSTCKHTLGIYINMHSQEFVYCLSCSIAQAALLTWHSSSFHS